jgi:hypothetical protein
MALTLTRWMTALVIGALIIIVVLIIPRRPDRPERQSAGFELLNDFRRFDAHAGRSARRVRTWHVVDSVMSSLARLPRATQSRIVFAKGLERSLPVLRMAVGRMDAFRPATPAAPIDLALVYEPPVMIQGHETQGYWGSPVRVLPRTTGDRCVTIVRMPKAFGSQEIAKDDYDWMRNRIFRSFQNGEVLGACAFYEAFGAPGPGIDRWLRSGGWRFGLAGTVPARQEWRAFVDSALLSPWSAWLEGDFRRQFPPKGYRCLTGDAQMCTSIVLDAGADAGLTLHTRVFENGVLDFRGSFADRWVDGNLGWPQQWMFADLIRSLGEERFRRFWTSDKAPGEAFADAFGQDIGEWTVQWARDVYGVRGRSPTVSASSALVAVLVILLALGSAIATARRQQVAA